MENTTEAPVVEVLPIDHESNRLGTVIVNTYDRMIYQHTRHNGDVVYFAWEIDTGRGYKFTELEDAAKSLGLRKPTGCADYNGHVRLGKCIEKFTDGEIWKHVTVYNTSNALDFTDYYVWWNNGVCDSALNLAAARRLARVNTGCKNGKVEKTLPKSAYPQNQKGYKPNTGSAPKARAKVNG